MNWIYHILNTIFFMYQQPYNKDWDKKLNELLDEYGSNVVVSRYCATLGEYDVWIANKWYAYGNAYMKNSVSVGRRYEFRPKFRTMLRLDKTVRYVSKDEVKEFYK